MHTNTHTELDTSKQNYLKKQLQPDINSDVHMTDVADLITGEKLEGVIVVQNPMEYVVVSRLRKN